MNIQVHRNSDESLGWAFFSLVLVTCLFPLALVAELVRKAVYGFCQWLAEK